MSKVERIKEELEKEFGNIKDDVLEDISQRLLDIFTEEGKSVLMKGLENLRKSDEIIRGFLNDNPEVKKKYLEEITKTQTF